MGKNLSRRDFLKSAALSAAGIGVLGAAGMGNAAVAEGASGADKYLSLIHI